LKEIGRLLQKNEILKQSLTYWLWKSAS